MGAVNNQPPPPPFFSVKVLLFTWKKPKYFSKKLHLDPIDFPPSKKIKNIFLLENQTHHARRTHNLITLTIRRVTACQ